VAQKSVKLVQSYLPICSISYLRLDIFDPRSSLTPCTIDTHKKHKASKMGNLDDFLVDG
jgi:hypothetical protein